MRSKQKIPTPQAIDTQLRRLEKDQQSIKALSKVNKTMQNTVLNNCKILTRLHPLKKPQPNNQPLQQPSLFANRLFHPPITPN